MMLPHGINQRKIPIPQQLVISKQPSTSQPVITQPIITQPVITQPIITQPVITQPVITQSVITQPVITQPIVSQLPIVPQNPVTPKQLVILQSQSQPQSSTISQPPMIPKQPTQITSDIELNTELPQISDSEEHEYVSEEEDSEGLNIQMNQYDQELGVDIHTSQYGVIDIDADYMEDMLTNIYLIKCAPTNLYNISCSYDIDVRMRELEMSSPLVLMPKYYCPGGFELEKILRRRYAEWNTREKWFNLSNDLSEKLLEEMMSIHILLLNYDHNHSEGLTMKGLLKHAVVYAILNNRHESSYIRIFDFATRAYKAGHRLLSIITRYMRAPDYISNDEEIDIVGINNLAQWLISRKSDNVIDEVRNDHARLHHLNI